MPDICRHKQFAGARQPIPFPQPTTISSCFFPAGQPVPQYVSDPIYAPSASDAVAPLAFADSMLGGGDGGKRKRIAIGVGTTVAALLFLTLLAAAVILRRRPRAGRARK